VAPAPASARAPVFRMARALVGISAMDTPHALDSCKTQATGHLF
jgi:hypothetical protein